MKKRSYEMNDDYILDILEKEENKLSKELFDGIPNDMLFKFSKFIAVKNAIESINIKNAFEEGTFNKVI